MKASTFNPFESRRIARIVGVALAGLLLAGTVGAATPAGAAGARGAQSPVNKPPPPKTTVSQKAVVSPTGQQTTTNGYHADTSVGQGALPQISWGRGAGQQVLATSDKAAQKAAHQLNKIEDKAIKKADKDNNKGGKGGKGGYRDDGSGNCGPDSTTLC